jgi:tetratricopeptide (TPR) repeat protein
MPATVQAVLAARIDRLPIEEKRLLQCAAVVGKDVPFALLQAITAGDGDWGLGIGEGRAARSPNPQTPAPNPQLRAQLAHLQAAEFVYEASLFPNLEYTFKHALTHEVAYGSLLQDRRRALHARIVEATEQLYAGRLVEQVEGLAHHAVRGELWGKAVHFLREAAAKAAARSAHPEAVGYWEEALAALDHLPRDRDAMELGIDLRTDLRNSLYSLGEMQKIHEHLEVAEKLASELGDEQRLGWVSTYRANYYWMEAKNDLALDFGRRALAIAHNDLRLQLESRYRVAQICRTVGQHRRALDLWQQNIAALQGHRERDRFGLTGLPAALNRGWAAWCLAELGEFERAVPWAEEAVRLAESADHAFSLAGTLPGAAMVYAIRGDVETAISQLERALATCRAYQLLLLTAYIGGPLGLAYTLAGRLREAMPLLEEAVGWSATVTRPFYSTCLTWLGEAHLAAGRPGDAADAGQQALAYARAHGERANEAHALRLLGDVGCRWDPPAPEAEGSYLQALNLARELGLAPMAAHCQRGLGVLYGRTGRRDQGRAELEGAIEAFRTMGMTLWLPQAEAELESLWA